MTLNIHIAPESEQFFREQAASSGEDISLAAGKWVDQHVRIERQVQGFAANSNSLDELPLPDDVEERTKLARALLQQYAREQGVGKFVLDPPGLGDRYPEDGQVELIDQGIRAMRDQDPCRVSP